MEAGVRRNGLVEHGVSARTNPRQQYIENVLEPWVFGTEVCMRSSELGAENVGLLLNISIVRGAIQGNTFPDQSGGPALEVQWRRRPTLPFPCHTH